MYIKPAPAVPARAGRRHLHLLEQRLPVARHGPRHLHRERNLLRVSSRFQKSAIEHFLTSIFLIYSVVTHTGAASYDGFVACKGD